jgi:hypothetical protein
VTALLDAIARVFVASPAQARCAPVAAAVPSAAVCGQEGEAVAAALALRLRTRGPVVVCAWASPARRASAPATAGARRLAASMHARGLDAAATGRLVLVRLDDDPPVAVAEAERAAAAAGDAPIVTAICGPRDPAFDALLEAQDCAIVVARDVPDEVRRLAVAALGPRAVAVSPLAAVSDWAARAGVWASPAARRALADVQAVLR